MPSTGRAGTIGGVSADALFHKSFFSKLGLMPKKKIMEVIHDGLPSPDFQNLNGGSIAQVGNRIKMTNAGTPANFGWDMGTAYTKVLIIAQLVRQLGGAQTEVGIFTSQTLPAGSEVPDGWVGTYTPFFGAIGLNRHASSAYAETVQVESQSLIGTANGVQGGPNVAVAMFVDTVAPKQTMFLRSAAEQWTPIAADASNGSGVADLRYVGFRPNITGGKYAWFGQLGVYAE